MRMPLPAFLVLVLGLVATAAGASNPPNPEIVSLGHDTYALTRWAETGFTRNTAKLKTQALEDAAAYCASLHKELKVLSTTTARPTVPLTGFARAKVVFKALDANDPELHTSVVESESGAPVSVPAAAPALAPPAPRSDTDGLYSDLMKLDDLRKRGLITEEQFQALRNKLVEKSK